MNWYKASRTVSGDLFCGKKERSSGWGERLAAIAPVCSVIFRQQYP
ncbi:MAG: hypothetical protein RMY36_010605 [Nostoc sp. SerVER01]|nr:hypothetical protein [Nostoc sp. SerVER01]